MHESASSGLARLHVLLDPTLPAYQQWPTEALIWTRASMWATRTETGSPQRGCAEVSTKREEARNSHSDLQSTPG